MNCKKILISAVMSAIFSLNVLPVLADVDAGYSPVTQNMSIRGDAGDYNAGNNIPMLLLKSEAQAGNYTYDQIGYVEQGKISSDGTYEFDFKFEGDVEDYKLLMNLAGENVTDTVTKATAKMDLFDVELKINKDSTTADIIGEIHNRYGISGQDYNLMLAFYDSEGILLGIKHDLSTGTVEENVTDIATEKINIPSGTATMKAVLWDSNQTMIPLCMPVERGKERIVCWHGF